MQVGYRKAELMHKNQIDVSVWDSLLVQTKQWLPCVTTELKVYHINDLTYEFSQEHPPICYTDVINDLELIKIGGMVTYHRLRTVCQCNFQPIIGYYNVYRVVRHIFVEGKCTILFEKKTTDNNYQSHEIMIIYRGTGEQFQLDKNKYVSQFLTAVRQIIL
jgi:hypothetical protein